MAFLPLEIVKGYLRVDHDADDQLIESLTLSAIDLVQTRLRRPIVGSENEQAVVTDESKVPESIKLSVLVITAFLYENRSATDEEIRNRVLRQALLDQFILWD